MNLKDLSLRELRVEIDGTFLSVGTILEKNRPKKLIALNDKSQLASLIVGEEVSAVITSADLASYVPRGLGLAVAPNPEKMLLQIHNSLVRGNTFYDRVFKNEIHQDARIHPSATIASESVKIDKGCIIGPNVQIFENSILESDVNVGAGSVIGSERTVTCVADNETIEVLSAGMVILHRNVVVQCNSCVSKAILGGHTEVSEYTQVGDLAHIGANSKIGKRCRIGPCVSVGANVWIGDDVWVGPNSTVSDGVTIGDRGSVTIGSVVVEDVASGRKVTGNFAIDHSKFIESIKKIR